MIIGGPVLYDIADTPAVMRWYRELLPTLPEELSGWFGADHHPARAAVPRGAVGPQGRAPSSGATPAPHDRADEVLEPVREFGSPLVVGLQPMPFSALQSAFDPLYRRAPAWSHAGSGPRAPCARAGG